MTKRPQETKTETRDGETARYVRRQLIRKQQPPHRYPPAHFKNSRLSPFLSNSAYGLLGYSSILRDETLFAMVFQSAVFASETISFSISLFVGGLAFVRRTIFVGILAVALLTSAPGDTAFSKCRWCLDRPWSSLVGRRSARIDPGLRRK